MKMLIDGQYRDSSTGEIIKVNNPWTGELIDTVPAASAADVDEAVRAAARAQKSWRGVPVHERAAIAERFLTLVDRDRSELACLLSRETGKPIAQAQIEITNIFTAWKAFCEKAKHLYDGIIPAGEERSHEKNLVMMIREPLGVIACIIPFNFPCNLFDQKAAPAILAGNAAIIKPASDDPLTVCRLVGLLHEAGIPRGVIQTVTGRGSVAGTALACHPQVSAVSLTGSTDVGVRVAGMAASTLKSTALELGGNDAFIVLPDADLELAVNEAVTGRFFNAGQICCAPKRFLVHRSVYDAFTEAVISRTSAITPGDPADQKTALGTLISEKAARRVEEQIAQAIGEGACLACGGVREGAAMTPAVLTDVPHDAAIMHDMEVFGPVLPVTSFDTEEEALALANDTMYGLGASVFTSDMKKASRFARDLEAGSVVINGSSYFRSFEMPFGGLKMSGIGQEGVASTFDEMTSVKCVTLKGIF